MSTETQSAKMLSILNTCYEKAVSGVPYVSDPVEVLAEEYLKGAVRGSAEARRAAERMIRNQVTKCTLDGAVTSIGGFATMAATFPANIASVMYMQLRMIACVAYMAGYDVHSDEVQTMCYACYAGLALSNVIKDFAQKFGTRLAANLIKKIPGRILRRINRVVGMRLVARSGTKAMITLSKCIPAVGAVIGGGIDGISTKVIANRAMKNFFDNDFSDGEPVDLVGIDPDDGSDGVIDAKDAEWLD